MKTLYKIFLFFGMLAIVFSLQTCKKNHYLFKTRIEGTLTNKTTGEPMPGVEIKMYRSWTNHYGQINDEYVSSFYTNDQGKYDYSFDAEKEHPEAHRKLGYFIKPYIPFNECVELSGTLYYNGVNDGGHGWGLEPGHKNKVNIEYEPFPPAWLTLHIKNQTPYSNNDKIQIEYNNLTFGYTCIFKYDAGSYIGANVDTTIVLNVNRNTWGLGWDITKNGITTTDGEIFYFLQNDNQSYNLFY